MNKEPETAFDFIEYPCEYRFKAVCRTVDNVAAIISQEVERVVGADNVLNSQSRPSKNGRFVSVTITAKLVDKSQLEKTYQGLADCVHVVMTL